jgi:cell division control protein 6
VDTAEKERAKKRTLFVIAANDENINPFFTPTTSETPRTKKSTPRVFGQSAFNEARNALRKGSARLIGRGSERDELETFVSSRLARHKSGSIYISGPPGTGKSAMVTEVLDNAPREPSVKISFINCMTVKDASGVSAKLLADFDKLDVLQGSEATALQSLFHFKNMTHLVVLDEIDHLLGVDLEFLYKMFEWSLHKKSNLILIGIANALDFTDRLLPRLKSKGLKPQLLPFMPYTVAQITSVLTAKLRSALPSVHSAAPDFVPFVHPAALQFAAKKVAAQTGDLRKALSICIRAIDLVESETRAKVNTITPPPSPSPSKKHLAESRTHSPSQTPLMENMNLSSPPNAPSRHGKASPPLRRSISDQLSQFTAETAPRATIAHMARVTASVFSNGTSSRLTSLNLQQKAALCALCVLEAKHRSARRSPVDGNGNPVTPSKKDSQPSAPSVKMLYDAYSQLCKRDNALHALTNTEFRDVLGSLEALSLVISVEGRNGSLTPSRTPSGTPSRRGRAVGGFGKVITEEQRVTSAVGVKEVRESLDGPGAGVLRALIDGERMLG